MFTFTNNNALSARALQAFIGYGALSTPQIRLVENAPGCPTPTISGPSHQRDVNWGTPCVDQGESFILEFTHPTGVTVECADWILSDDTRGDATVNGTTVPRCVPATPTPMATPAPGLHDGRAKKISAAGSVVLTDGTPDTKNIAFQVRNEGDHTESFGVYLDIVAPGGSNGSNPNGCTPHGRIIDTVVALAPGEQTVVETTQTFNCADVSGALGQTYTLMGVVDAHADDGGACGPFQIQTMACFNALADDDDDDADNRVTTNAFRVR